MIKSVGGVGRVTAVSPAGDHADLPDIVPVVYADGRAGEPMPWRFVEHTEAQGKLLPPVSAAHADDRQPD